MKKLLKALVALALVAAGGVGYARYIEPRRLAVETIKLETQRVDGPVRMVAFGDVHLGNGTDVDRLNDIIDRINGLEPDCVLFLGDLFDDYSTYEGDPGQVSQTLLRLKAPVRLAVYGNHDLGGGAQRVYPKVIKEGGFTLLVNQAYDLGNGLRFVGGDDLIFGTPDVMGRLAQGDYHVLLIHEPDYADQVTGFDLQVSGHTHGAQVRLPLTEKWVLPFGGRNYVRGLSVKEDGGRVYVNRGIGMSILPYRFASVPELTVIEIN